MTWGNMIDFRRKAASLALFAGLIFIFIILAVAGTYIFLGMRQETSVAPCDTNLLSQIGASTTSTQLCLHEVVVSISSANSSEFYVPVLEMNKGSTGSIDSLYHLSAESKGHLRPPLNLSSNDVPNALLVPTATLNRSLVAFSNGVLIFQNKDWAIYRYIVNASSDSAGYYALLPPYYYGIYPALAIGADPYNLNISALSIWGYAGTMVSGEDIPPSMIVGVSGIDVVNVTIPALLYCPIAACVIVSRSEY